MEKMGGTKMMILMIVGIVLIVAAFAAGYFFLFARPNQPLRNGQVMVGSAVFNVEIASSTVEKARGLSYRTSLGENSGMLFLFDRGAVQNFWMKDMNFPLDMIWIGGGRVLGFAENAAPQPGAQLWELKVYNSPDGTDQVLEVNAGTVAKDNINVGDPVSMGPAQ